MPAPPTSVPRKPVIATSGAKDRFTVFGGEAVTPIVGSEDVGGAYAIWLHEAAPGVSPPRHVHHREDEVFHILEEQLLIWCDGQTYEANPGDTAVLPKGLPHSWLVTSLSPVKLIATVCPGGMERFFPRMAALGAAHASLSDLEQLTQKFDIEFIGSPLERADLI